MTYSGDPRAAVSYSITSLLPSEMVSTFTNAGTWPTADLALYCPIVVTRRVLVKKLVAGINTASGNVCMGVYDDAGTRLITSGSTAAAIEQVFDVTDTPIGPGIFYLALVADNTTITVTRANDAAPLLASFGLLSEQLGASAALPATASWSLAQSQAYWPSMALLMDTTNT